jgi:5'-nucleotidase
VNIALAHLIASQIDGVVSGINVGLNASLGFVLASGTIAGAWEGALHGLPAAAFSQDLTFEEYDRLKYGKPERHGASAGPTGGTYGGDAEVVATLKRSAAIAARLATDLIGNAGRREFTVHNINFPHRCPADAKVVRTVPAQVVVPELFGPAQDDGTHRFVFKLGEDVSPAGQMTDRAALAAGFVSHTVLDYRALGNPGSATPARDKRL